MSNKALTLLFRNNNKYIICKTINFKTYKTVVKTTYLFSYIKVNK